jgi:hypothetical protein
MIRTSFPVNTSSKALVNLMSRSRIRKSETASTFAEIHEQVPGLLRGPRSGGVRGDAQDVYTPGVDHGYASAFGVKVPSSV